MYHPVHKQSPLSYSLSLLYSIPCYSVHQACVSPVLSTPCSSQHLPRCLCLPCPLIVLMHHSVVSPGSPLGQLLHSPHYLPSPSPPQCSTLVCIALCHHLCITTPTSFPTRLTMRDMSPTHSIGPLGSTSCIRLSSQYESSCHSMWNVV